MSLRALDDVFVRDIVFVCQIVIYNVNSGSTAVLFRKINIFVFEY